MNLKHNEKEDLSMEHKEDIHKSADDSSGYNEETDGKVDWTSRQILATISLSALWVGSQIPLYFVGGSLSYIAADIGGVAADSWLPVANTLCLAAISPFCGYLQDLFGRRIITLVGSVLIMVGIVLVGTAHSFGQGVAGMSIAGCGAGIGELTALAGTSELVPVRKRGYFIGLIILFLLPFTPYVLYSQLLATRATWRWVMWISLIYNGLAFLGILFTYFPEKIHVHNRSSKMEILKRVDFVGGALSIIGVTLFLVAIQSGGYTHPWSSAYVLCTLIIGIVLILAFIVWEWRGVEQPLIPKELFVGRRAITFSFLVAFVGGMNFYSLINFFPLSFSTVYSPDPIQVGLKGLGYGISVTAGAAAFNILLSVFKNHNRELLMLACVIMTAFAGALASMTPDNPKTTVALGTIAGFGVGGILVPTQTIALTAAPDELIATTVALSLAFRVIGGSIGYAIYFNIFINQVTPKLPAYVAEFVLKAGLAKSEVEEFVGVFLTTPDKVTSIPGVNTKILEAAVSGSQWAYADSFKYVWYSSIAFGVISIIACFFIGNTRKYLTDRVAAKIRG